MNDSWQRVRSRSAKHAARLELAGRWGVLEDEVLCSMARDAGVFDAADPGGPPEDQDTARHDD